MPAHRTPHDPAVRATPSVPTPESGRVPPNPTTDAISEAATRASAPAPRSPAPPPKRHGPAHPWRWLAVGAAVVVAVTSFVPNPAVVAGTATGEVLPSWSNIPAPTAAVARPTRVRIPAIGVDSAIVDIGVDATGVLVPPEGPDVTGWFTKGSAPGDVGPALLAGHVDSHAGPAVFFRLGDLGPGDEVLVDREDGSTAKFTVATTTRVPKTAFPTDLVYAPVPTPVLRLVTCGGTLDTAARSYRDNVIVEAVPE
ncbi:class F sortase [Actinosynnema sp. NPDC020468]|uniref:class F sortase n=1 Tax=Actinosynnema sp. NPDC020468 TaxID=3154488 RepID=UPI003411D007